MIIQKNWSSIKNCLRKDLGIAVAAVSDKIDEDKNLREVAKIVKDNVPLDLKKEFKQFVQEAKDNPQPKEKEPSMLEATKNKVTDTASAVTTSLSNTATSVKNGVGELKDKAQMAVAVSKYAVKSTASNAVGKVASVGSQAGKLVSGVGSKIWGLSPFSKAKPKTAEAPVVTEESKDVEASPVVEESQPLTVKEPASQPSDNTDDGCPNCDDDGNCTDNCNMDEDEDDDSDESDDE